MNMFRYVVGALLLLLWCPPSAKADSFEVIVNASNPATAMSRDEVSKLFLKKEDRWESGLRVIPVDQKVESPSREHFSTAVLRKPVKTVKAYWRKVVFSGLNEPPHELDSDAAVVEFVTSNVGAIGYVSAETPLGKDVKVLSIKD